MNVVVKCPNCAKVLTYEASDAGMVSLCPACGATLRLPDALPPPLPPPETTPLRNELPPTPKFNPLIPWVIALGLACLVIGSALLTVTLRPHPDWEHDNRQQILDMQTEARALEQRGQLREAYDRYGDLLRMVIGNPISDPALKQTVQDAQEEQSKLLEKIIRNAVASAVPRPAAPPVVFTAPETAPSPPPATEAVIVSPPRPPVHPLPPPDLGTAANGRPMVDDEEIGRAINRGVTVLYNRFQDNKIQGEADYPDEGVDALAVYALLQAYQATDDPRLDPRRPFMKQALDTLKRFEIDNDYGSKATYGRSLRISALTLAGRPEDRAQIDGDLQWLMHAGLTGAYTYINRPYGRTGTMIDTVWDNSNSQYGLLGVWAAAETGLAVPEYFWKVTQEHWVSTQFDDGEWGYMADDTSPRRSMTLAGLASLFVTQDYLFEPGQGQWVAREPFMPALAKGLNWLESGDNSVIPFSDEWPGYTLYGLERVGLASGFKYFGAHDWYRESAADVVASVSPDGGWGSSVDTSFALLILSRGRHPVMMNKLRFDGYWCNRPRDVANLARYGSKTLERQLNWQVVPLDHDWVDWTDCPVLYLASHQPPNFQPADEEKLRQFILSGGLLLTQADGDSPAFTLWVEQLGRRLFPLYQWTDLPAHHPLWTVALHVKNRPRVLALGNGARLFMIHLPQDVSRYWQARAEIEHVDDFVLGLDIFLYAAGRTELRNRLVSSVILPAPGDANASIGMALLGASEDSDPEPDAWPRFALWFRRQTDLDVKLSFSPLDALDEHSPPLAHLTGVRSFTPTDKQCHALHDYVNHGGVVFIDPCGGPNGFLQTVREELLPRAFPEADLSRLPDDHPLLTSSGDGMSQLSPLQVRDFVRELPTPIDRGLWILRSGKGCVIVSSVDVTSGLLGSNTWGISGFTPEYCMNLAKNWVLWTWDGAKD